MKKIKFLHNIRFDIDSKKTGAAALLVLLITVAITAILIGGLSFIANKEAALVKRAEESNIVLQAAESGIEEVITRLRAGETPPSPLVLPVGNASATVTTTTLGNQRTITSVGTKGDITRTIQVKMNLDVTKADFFYGIQVGEGGVIMNPNSRVVGSMYSDGNIIGANGTRIDNDVLIGSGGADYKIDSVSVGGNVTAHRIENSTIGGNANAIILNNSTVVGNVHADSISTCTITGNAAYNSKLNCTVGGTETTPTVPPEDPPSVPLPITDESINAWKIDAQNGGTCEPPICDVNGNLTLGIGQSLIIGPKKITGNLTLDNKAKLTLTGTLWVQGDITFSNGDPNSYMVRLDASYGSLSGVILADGEITVQNNVTFQGSGMPGSYVMALSAKDSVNEEIITINNVSDGVVFYAGKGLIKFQQNSTAFEATAYGIVLENGAIITYQSGLANAQFSSGPAAGWSIISWNEL